METNKSNNKETAYHIPDEVIESLARCILPSVQAYFATEEGQRAFAEWKKQKEAQQRASQQPKKKQSRSEPER